MSRLAGANVSAVRFPTRPEDHLALHAEIDRELGSADAKGAILTWMSAHGAAWLDTGDVLREGDYSGFESQPPTIGRRSGSRIGSRS